MSGPGPRFWRIFRRDGAAAALRRVRMRAGLVLRRELAPHRCDYLAWIAENEPDLPGLVAQRETVRAMAHRPFFTVFVCGSPSGPRDREAVLAGLEAQTYPDWELHTPPAPGEAGPGRGRTPGVPRGGWWVLLSRGARLAPDALFEAARRVGAGEVDAVYADNDVLDRKGRRSDPFFKPDFSPELLLNVDYLAPFLVVRSSWLEGEALPETEAEHWALSCRLAESRRAIAHVPKILSHAARACDPAAGRRAVEASLRRQGVQATVEITSDRRLHAVWPISEVEVGVVIPTRDGEPRLRPCLASLARTRGRLSIVVVDNGSTDPATIRFLDEEQRAGRVTVLRRPGPFNWSALNNAGVVALRAPVLAFLNDDIEATDDGWLEELVRWALRPEIGVAGGLLRRPDGSVQHAGVAFGIGGLAAHPFDGAREDGTGLLGPVGWYRNWLAVTGACQVMRREVWEKLGGFDEEFGALFSDVDLCLRAWRLGLRNVCTPYARLVHHHGTTRGGDRLMPPHDFIVALDRFGPLLAQGDPFFNPNLSRWSALPTLRRLGEADAGRWLEVLAQLLRERYPGEASQRPQPVAALGPEVDTRLRAADAHRRGR